MLYAFVHDAFILLLMVKEGEENVPPDRKVYELR
jgi:hypothetical protein